MPEDGGLTTAESKIARKLRGKFFAKDKGFKSRDEQVDDFLSSSRSSTSTLPTSTPSLHHSHSQSQSQPRPSPRSGITPPRIDVTVSQRWPDHRDVLAQAAASQEDTASIYSQQPKIRRNKGLRVRFSSDPPHIIGEGGEEAFAPTKDVCLYPMRPDSSSAGPLTLDRTSSNQIYGHPHHRSEPPPSLTIARSSQENILGYDLHESPQSSTIPNAQASEFMLSLAAPSQSKESKRLSWKPTPGDNSVARTIQAKMRAEEGLALQRASHLIDQAREPASSGDSIGAISPVDDDLYSHTTEPISPQHETQQKSSGLSLWTNVMNSLPGETKNTQHEQHPPLQTPTEQRYVPYSPVNNTPKQPQKSTPPPPYLRTESKQSTYSDKSTERPSPHSHHARGSSSSVKRDLKSVASAAGEAALADFSSYVSNFSEIFTMSADNLKPIMETSLSEWVRASVWWFLQGRAGLERFMRSRPSSSAGNAPHAPATENSQQAIVDLAKAWWINQSIVPGHPELKEFGNMSTDSMLVVAESLQNGRMIDLIGVHQSIISHVRALSMSMKRNGLIPNSDRPQISKGTDTSIWIRYPFFAPAISGILSNSSSRSLLVNHSAKQPDIGDLMPLGDTGQHFCYGRMFVEACLSSEDDGSEGYSIPCVLSITRGRTDWDVIASITSQNELVNLVIQPDKKKGPTWNDVNWHVRSHSMTLSLTRGFELDVQFTEPEFKMLWKIVEYNSKVKTEMDPTAGERMLFGDVLKSFQYMSDSPSSAFPPEASQYCRFQLFGKSTKITEGTGTRTAHRGFRLLVVTSPKTKTLSSVCHPLGDGSPIVFGYLRGDDGAPAMMLKGTNQDENYSMLMTFIDTEARSNFHSLLLGIVPGENEAKTSEMALKSFAISEVRDPNTGLRNQPHLMFNKSTVTIINKISPPTDHSLSATLLSNNLRVFVSSDWGSITDRINIGPGDLKIGFDINNPTAINVTRPAHNDLGIAVAENLIPSDVPSKMKNLLNISRLRPIIRHYDFASIPELHKFQQAVTGFKVLFDGNASMFAISRRRMVVPIYKKWEASKARLQIVQQEKVVQLIAFLGGFSHGKCMNFVIKSTDVFESFNRAGKYGIKIIDAKFSLPKPIDDENADFICLDMPEYPGEHDDITIAFDLEKDRHNFQAAVPGSVREPSRMSSLRK
ncbi:hypothetical protein FQN57_004520 [Myotisia sp. PD_48]|nr:hypothetical protein FQN57_004520 [Myotisia sp. PD_48]